MSNRNYNTQTNPNRQKLMNGGRAKKMGGGMMRKDMQSGYYPSDMGMSGGAMMKKGGRVKKKKKLSKMRAYCKSKSDVQRAACGCRKKKTS